MAVPDFSIASLEVLAEKFLNDSLRGFLLILLFWRLPPAAGLVRQIESGLKLTRRGEKQHFHVVFERAGKKTRDMTVNISPSDSLLLQILFYESGLHVSQFFQILVLVLRICEFSTRVEVG